MSFPAMTPFEVTSLGDISISLRRGHYRFATTLVTGDDVVELGPDVKNSHRNGRFLEQRDAQNLQELVEADVEGEPLLDDGHEDRDRQGDPDRGLDRVLTRAREGLDPQMLCDPAEQLNDILPINSALTKSRLATASIH